MHTSMRLSVLDAIPVGPAVTPKLALEWTTAVAQVAEQLGYHRFWVVEHHGAVSIGCSAPAVMIAHLATHTTTIRLGSGGVMLPNHPPLVTAEEFCMLEGLHPGRIDLGVGRSNGADPTTTLALEVSAEHMAREHFSNRLDDLLGFLEGSFPCGHPFEHVPIPLQSSPIPVFLLGSTESSARLAATRGMPYAYGYHLNSGPAREALATYRSSFRPRNADDRPHAIISVVVVCAETRDEAEHSAMTSAIIRLRKNIVQRDRIALDDDVLVALEWTEDERRVGREGLDSMRAVIGDIDRVQDELLALQAATGADELMIATIEYDGPSRVRTLNCVARPP